MKHSKRHQNSNPLRLVFDTAALQPNRMKTILNKPTVTLALAAFCWCATGQTQTAASTAKPAIVYVTDFELHPADIKSGKGLLPPPPKPPGPFGNLLPPLPGTPKDPEKLARELVDTMSASIVKDLTKAGLTARRLPAGEPLPTNGWLVRGVFTEVNQGNNLQRAVIGFGLGKTDLQVVVVIADLTQGAPRDFYELKTDANSGKLPGAGPMIALNPAVGAARFVIATGDLKRNVKQTAAKIASEVVERCEGNKTILTAETQRRGGEAGLTE